MSGILQVSKEFGNLRPTARACKYFACFCVAKDTIRPLALP